MKGHSPQAQDIEAFSRNYVAAEPNITFILPANFIRKQIPRTSKKQNRSAESQSVLSSLFCGIKEKYHNRTNKTFQPSNRHSFIDSVDSGSSELSSSSTTKRSVTPDSVTVLFSDGKMNFNGGKIPSSISSPNLAKEDSASSSTSSSNRLLNHDLLSEEYAQKMAERERRTEERERKMSGSRSTQTPSSANGDINRTPKSKKKTVMLQPAPNREIKPSTILRLPDRDLVVIDRQEIKEAVRNESDVIIVDPPPMPATTPNDGEHADLSDILGSQWPDLAGAGASLLNNEKKANSTVSNGWRTVERNKSTNLASHFSSSSKHRYETQNGYRKSE